MDKLSKYNNFLLERQFQSIIDDIYLLVESEGKWTGSNTYEWDMSKPKNNKILDKLKKFLSNLSKEKIRDYFYKLVDKLKSLPTNIRKKTVVNYAAVFLIFVSASYLLTPTTVDAENIQSVSTVLTSDVRKDIRGIEVEEPTVITKASFENAQDVVKQAEGGYSDDKGDTGNWIKVAGGKRFVGTNHGISAPILADYLGKTPSKEDMQNLSYETALEIYKKNYWDKYNMSDYNNQEVANIIYDGIVNQGQTGMRIVMRNVLNDNGISITDNDNPFNTEWIEKINGLDQKVLFNSIKKFREQRYKESKTFSKHGEGWLNRLNTFVYDGENKLMA